MAAMLSAATFSGSLSSIVVFNITFQTQQVARASVQERARLQRAAASSAVRAGAEVGRGVRARRPKSAGRRTECGRCQEPGTPSNDPRRARGLRLRSTRRSSCMPKPSATGLGHRHSNHQGGFRRARAHAPEQNWCRHGSPRTRSSLRRRSRATAAPPEGAAGSEPWQGVACGKSYHSRCAADRCAAEEFPGQHGKRLPKSRSTSRAQLWPGAPVTPPPGWAPAPHR